MGHLPYRMIAKVGMVLIELFIPTMTKGDIIDLIKHPLLIGFFLAFDA
ncbi:hypothetical protein C8N25_116105 [Algoriphagus antarcticus]|uniref:Uncharacterized protein n=1 Tax=Algoriphagus antarcticus TaxID=238540 RepID=A0A3E0DN05_9BACT|nr:hypothetical protein C8N25_116105 [Algoriphagus antarcticus]